MPEILLVDDSAFMRKLERKILAKAGYKDISEAENGKDAVKRYKAKKPDVVILDIIMTKEMSGIDVLRELKKFDNDVKVIIVTILEQEKVEEDAIRSGASAYITKPIDPPRLVSTLKRVLKK